MDLAVTIQQNIMEVTNVIKQINVAGDYYLEAADEMEEQQKQSEGLLKKGIEFVFGGAAASEFGKVAGISDAFARTNAKIGSMNDGLQSSADLQDMVYASAQRTGMDYGTMADMATQMKTETGGVFESSKEAAAFTEIFSKSLFNAGASQAETAAGAVAMAAALGDSVMSSDELTTVFGEAPGMVENIGDYMGVSTEQVRKMAEEGQLTSDIIKNSMLASTDEINEKFNDMPMTWEQSTSLIKNGALSAFAPILQKIQEITASEQFTKLVQGIQNGFFLLAAFAQPVVDGLIAGAGFIIDNWSIIAPILLAAAAAVGAYLLIVNGVTAAKAIWASVTAGVAAVQAGLNTTLLGCPIVWIVLAIIALIATLYAGVAAFNKFTGNSVSATGIIGGAFGVLLASIVNNFLLPIWNTFAVLGNFIGNVFHNPVEAVKVLFLDLAKNAIAHILNMAKAIETVINKIPGVEVDITSNLDGFYKKLEQTSQAVKSEAGFRESFQTIENMDYTKSFTSGYDMGINVEDKALGFMQKNELNPESFMEKFDASTYESQITPGVETIADNTGRTAESIEISEENLKYLHDIAEREVIDRTVFSGITVEMGGIQNQVTQMSDLDGIGEYLVNSIQEQMAVSVEGVY